MTARHCVALLLGMVAGGAGLTAEPDVTRYFSGRIGERPIVLTLEFRREALEQKPQRLQDYNLFGEYFFLDEAAPLPKYLQGKWQPAAKLIALEEYRQDFHVDRVRRSNNSTQRREQTGFFAGEMSELPSWALDAASTYQVQGMWIQTASLTPYAFYLGHNQRAKKRLEFELREGGSHHSQLLSGRFACSRTPSMEVEIEHGDVRAFSWTNATCSATLADSTQQRARLGTVLKPRKHECDIRLLNMNTHLFVAAGPWMCPCKGALLIDKASGACHDLWPK